VLVYKKFGIHYTNHTFVQLQNLKPHCWKFAVQDVLTDKNQVLWNALQPNNMYM
jgi:hypothetical protein